MPPVATPLQPKTGTAGSLAASAAVRWPFSWREIAVQAALVWLVTRASIVLLTYMVEAYVIPGPTTLHDLVVSWDKFDANWYIAISQSGYSSLQSVAFFPLYPALIKLASLALAGHTVFAALLVSNAASFTALLALGAVTANETWTANEPWRTMRVAVAYPFAFFLFAPYTESLFLTFAIFAVFCARRGYWRRAAACATLATLTRPTAVILVLPLAWEFGRQHGWWQLPIWHATWWREKRWQEVRWGSILRTVVRPVLEVALLVAGIPAVFVGLMVFTWIRFDHPLLIFKVHNLYWSRESEPIWKTVLEIVRTLLTLSFGSQGQAQILVDFGLVVACTAITLLMIRRVPFAYTLYMFGLLYVTVATPALTSEVLIEAAGRFLLPAFPCFMILGRSTEKRPWLDLLVVSFGLILQVLFAMLFLIHHLIE